MAAASWNTPGRPLKGTTKDRYHNSGNSRTHKSGPAWRDAPFLFEVTVSLTLLITKVKGGDQKFLFLYNRRRAARPPGPGKEGRAERGQLDSVAGGPLLFATGTAAASYDMEPLQRPGDAVLAQAGGDEAHPAEDPGVGVAHGHARPRRLQHGQIVGAVPLERRRYLHRSY